MATGMIITVSLLGIAIVMLVWFAFRLHKQVKSEKQLRSEAEESKQQIIVEQERNRQLKQEMTSNIAHELKTPVSSIRGYLEILLGDKPVDDEQRHYFLERCYSQTLRLSDLINDVSLINKLEESHELFPLESINVRMLAEEAIVELATSAEQHNITILDKLPESMTVTGNSMLVYSIFRNLIENAIVHAGDNITGLGLSIVKHAVLFHGGDIYVKNREGGGLEFFFSLKKPSH